MDRKKFINDLKSNLRGLDADKVDEITADYEEHFTVGKEKGRTEAEISTSLGDPVQLGKQMSRKEKVVKVEAKVAKAEDEPNPKNLARAIFATAALGAFNLVFVLGPVLGIYGVIFALAVSAISVLISGITVSVVSLATYFLPYTIYQIHPFVVFFLGLGISAFGFLLCIGMFYIVKYTFILTIKYLKFNIKIINPSNE